jgi:putative hydrolase of the HAD superfamily
MNRITSIIFDLDGTLYNSAALAHEIQEVAAAGLALQLGGAAVDAAAALSAAKAALSAATGHEATLSAACEKLGGDIKALHRYLAEQVHPERHLGRDDRVVGMLERLGRESGLYLYTNNNRSLTGRIMAATGMEGLFTEIFSVEDFWRAKPDRLALAKLYAAIGAEPGECLFVGDRYDVDLRLPEEHGSRVFLTRTIDELLSLEKSCSKGEWIDDRTG